MSEGGGYIPARGWVSERGREGGYMAARGWVSERRRGEIYLPGVWLVSDEEGKYTCQGSGE